MAATLQQLEIRTTLVNARFIRAVEVGLAADTFGLNWDAFKKNHFWIKTKSLFASLPLDNPEFPRLFGDLLLSELVSMFGGWDKYAASGTDVQTIGDLSCDLFKFQC